MLDSEFKKKTFMYKFYERKFLLKGNTLKTYIPFPKLIMAILEKRSFSFLRQENKDAFY